MSWYFKALKNFMKFAGRARRKEFWWFILTNAVIICVVPSTLVVLMNYSIIPPGIGLFIFVFYTSAAVLLTLPTISVSVRRLHDIGMSGLFLLVHFIPTIGTIIVVLLMLKKGDSGANAFGEDPLESDP